MVCSLLGFQEEKYVGILVLVWVYINSSDCVIFHSDDPFNVCVLCSIICNFWHVNSFRYSVWEQLWSWCFFQANKCLLPGRNWRVRELLQVSPTYFFDLSYWASFGVSGGISNFNNMFFHDLQCIWGWASRFHSRGQDLYRWHQNNRPTLCWLVFELGFAIWVVVYPPSTFPFWCTRKQEWTSIATYHHWPR